MVEKIEISAELVERVTRTFLKKMTGHLRGTKVAIMNATIQEGYNQFVGFPPEKLTKMNIIQRIGREISREMGINPNGSTKEREKYNKIKIKLRGNAATVILNNPDLSKKLEKIIKRKKFKWSTQIGNHKKWGPRFAKASKWIKKRRNL